MTRTLILGGGEPAKWIMNEINAHQIDIPIIGLTSLAEEHRQDDRVIDFVDPANLRGLIRKLVTHGVTSLAIFGTPFSRLSPLTISKSTLTILNALASNPQVIPQAVSTRPSLVFPNILFTALNRYLSQKNILTIGLQDVLTHIQKAPGTVFGHAEFDDVRTEYEATLEFLSTRRDSWRKHGTLRQADGQFWRQTTGTKSLLRKCRQREMSLEGSMLVIEEVEEFKNLDVPVIDEALVKLAIESGLRTIIVKGRNIVIEENKLRELVKTSHLTVFFT